MIPKTAPPAGGSKKAFLDTDVEPLMMWRARLDALVIVTQIQRAARASLTEEERVSARASRMALYRRADGRLPDGWFQPQALRFDREGRWPAEVV